jgi:hypothetical protein
MWNDNFTSWHPLADIKNSFPMQLAQYAISHKLDKETAFKWWIKPTLKHQDRFLKALKSKYSSRTHKFGIRVPTSVEEALAIDKETNTTYWHDAIQKEMRNCKTAFKILDDDERAPIGHKWIKCHLIFDVKMDFTRKARFVAGGHMTNPPAEITYSSVVTRDSIRLAFLIAALNDIKILATDIGNAYLNAKPREKVYLAAGPEFGAELQGRHVIIMRALYGLKSSGAAWRSHFANTLRTLGFVSCLADPDVWYRAAKKPCGMEYYEYILVYVDDVLALSHEPEIIMKSLEKYYRLKDGFAKPTQYLGAAVKEWTFPDDASRPKWALSSEQYIKEAMKNIERHLAEQNRSLRKSNQPMPLAYLPELDITSLLCEEEIHFYQSQISILRWMVELGRLDIYINVALLSSYLTSPRKGHLEAVYCIYGYLKAHMKSTMVFDDAYLNWNEGNFPTYDWMDFYGDVKEEIPKNTPQPRGQPI